MPHEQSQQLRTGVARSPDDTYAQSSRITHLYDDTGSCILMHDVTPDFFGNVRVADVV
jgi:hypothetical protein